MRARAACFLALSLLPRVALAQPHEAAGAQREADLLFQEGKALMDQGAYPEGCKKLGESLALLRRGGTLLNLAVCRHKEGRYATALRLYQEALELAAADKRADREDLARSSIEEVRAKLSWLTVHVSEEAKIPGLTLTLDGAPLDAAKWGALLPVDPGAHVLKASAPDHEPFQTTLTIGGERDRKTISVPKLRRSPALSPPQEPTSTPPPAPAPAPSTARRAAGIATLTVGTLMLGAGTAFGIKAILDSHRSKELCPNARCTTDEGLDKNESARVAARVADVMIPVGILVAAGGLFLTLYAPKPSSRGRGSNASHAPRLSFTPSLGPSSAQMTVGGAF